MAMRGERFELDLDPEEAYARSLGQTIESDPSSGDGRPQGSLGLDFVKDVLEHDPGSTTAPQPPTLKQSATSTGFPAHKKRISRFKRSRGGTGDAKGGNIPGSATAKLPDESTYLSRMSKVSAADKEQIDRQTTQLLESMTEEQVREAQGELMSDPSFEAIKRLLLRSRIDADQSSQDASESRSNTRAAMQEAKSESQIPKEGPQSRDKEAGAQQNSTAKKRVSFAANVTESGPQSSQNKPVKSGSAVPLVMPKNSKPVSTSFRTPFYQTKYSGKSLNEASGPSSPSLAERNEATLDTKMEDDSKPLETGIARDGSSSHPPKREASKTQQPLDPNSDTFLADLHETYFPNLPSDPKSLSWMEPIKAETTLDDATARIPPASLRFGFRGEIISASSSAKIPVTKGLHHHGRNPDAAGYTIGELAIYARSTLAAQRCFAYQLAGRILYRLGTGDYKIEGRPADMNTDTAQGTDAPLDSREEGLWQEVRKGHIIDQIVTEANRDAGSGSESARVWAIEAVWLWRQGGGREFRDDEDGDDNENIMGDHAAQVLAEGLNTSF